MDSTCFEQFSERLRDFIMRSAASCSPDHGQSPASEAEFGLFALELFAMQYRWVAPYRTWCETRGIKPQELTHWSQIPALPAVAFKEQNITCLAPSDRTVVFHSSGTSANLPSKHYHDGPSLRLYETSLWNWFRIHLLPDFENAHAPGPRFVSLTPPPDSAPHSSLVHMIATVARRVGDANAVFAGRVASDNAWVLDADMASAALDKAVADGVPVCVLATAFQCVELIDSLTHRRRRVSLPKGSRLMETGGYKGRSRELPKQRLYGLVGEWLGIRPECIVSEYGMTELGSQAYDAVVTVSDKHHDTATASSKRLFRFPPWARIQIISAETGAPVRVGDPGLLRIFDLANLRSVLAIQTDDLAAACDDGFELLGRRRGAEQRGCSLMAR